MTGESEALLACVPLEDRIIDRLRHKREVRISAETLALVDELARKTGTTRLFELRRMVFAVIGGASVLGKDADVKRSTKQPRPEPRERSPLSPMQIACSGGLALDKKEEK